MSSILISGRRSVARCLSESQLSEMSRTDVLRLLKEMHTEMARTKLENLVIERYLEEHAPELLVGIANRMTKPRQQETRIHFAPVLNEQEPIRSHDKTASRMDTVSITTTKTNQSSFASSIRTNDSFGVFRVNYETRINMCEKDCASYADDIDLIRSRTKDELRRATARVEELSLTNKEAIETLKEFTHFVYHQGIKQKVSLERMLRFVEQYLKSANALKERMRLRTGTLKQQITHTHKALITKAELSGILRPIDFEQMEVEQQIQNREDAIKLNHVLSLKQATSEVALTVATQRKSLLKTNKLLNNINEKIARTNAECNRYDQLSLDLDKDIDQWQNRIDRLKERTENFIAPSTYEYILQKDRLNKLEHKKKILQRQLGIVEVKLQSSIGKLRQNKTKQIQDRRRREFEAQIFQELTKNGA